MDEFQQLQQQTVHYATMEDGREISLVSAITDDIFDSVFASEPEVKSGCDAKKKKFVTPKIKFQKEEMTTRLLDPESHIVNQVFRLFQREYSQTIKALLKLHFTQLRDVLGTYSETLRAQSPIDYRVDRTGRAIRAELEQDLVMLEQDVKMLKELVPKMNTQSDDTDAMMGDDNVSWDNLAAACNRLANKRKNDKDDGPKVKVKKESK